mmetsp:Transcript_10485/g.23818  ORF Transcript_10485/g.23818 Transcript_10485/m.23818 type:complete len:402 (-) Transcript_10485:799-2004(-)
MVAQLLEHGDRAQGLHATLALTLCVPHDLAAKVQVVQLQLRLRQTQPEHDISLWRKLLHRRCSAGASRSFPFSRDIHFEPPQEVGRRQALQLLGQVVLQLHRVATGVSLEALGDLLREVALEGGVVSEQPWLYQVHERPQVRELILQRRPCEQEAGPSNELPKSATDDARRRLDAVAFIDDDHIPWTIWVRLLLHVGKHRLVLARRVVVASPSHCLTLALLGEEARRRPPEAGSPQLCDAGPQQVIRHQQSPPLEQQTPQGGGPLLACPMEDVHRQSCMLPAPLQELLAPLRQQCHRDNDDEPRPQAAVLDAGEEGGRLDSLAQPHLIGKKSAEGLVKEARHPGESLPLVPVQSLVDILWKLELHSFIVDFQLQSAIFAIFCPHLCIVCMRFSPAIARGSL